MQTENKRQKEKASRAAKSSKYAFKTSEMPLRSDTNQISFMPERRESAATPLDFDNFIPWVCREWGVSCRVIVFHFNSDERFTKKDSVNQRQPLKISDSKQRDKPTKHSGSSIIPSKKNILDFFHPIPLINEIQKAVVVRASYNVNNQLEEISIVDCPVAIPKKVIRAVSLCLPFHSSLNRLNIRKGGLTHDVLYEIRKLLPHSNITTICFDDSIVPQGNYHVLLHETSQLNYLSLNRCKIGDEACKEISLNLVIGKPVANTLNILELSSNDITDTGALYLSKMLRANRGLLHLNLAGNKITDDGGKAILASMMEFQLSNDEVLEMKHRRYTYLRNKEVVFKKCLEQILYGKVDSLSSKASNTSKKSLDLLKSVKIKAKDSVRSRQSTTKSQERAATLAKGIVGEYLDGPMYSVLKNGNLYGKGNFTLCSLNLAYNSLHYPSLKKVDEVLSYQYRTLKIPPATGLIRIVLDGNYLPEKCNELNRIEMYLNSIICERAPLPKIGSKRRQSSGSLRKRNTILKLSK